MPTKGTEIVDVQYDRIKIDNEERAAVLFIIDGEEVWLPRSLIEVDRDSRVVTMPAWKAEEAGIEGSVVR